MYKHFSRDIDKMNEMYELPQVGSSVDEMLTRLDQFDKILTEECEEINDIALELKAGATTLKVRTELADLLGDIVVYCASEALRWNIPLDATLSIIMASNASKLRADGRPIKDERGKFLKGPNYWKPESMIEAMLTMHDANPDAEIKPLDMEHIAREALKGQEQQS